MKVVQLDNLKQELSSNTEQFYCVHITQESCPECMAQCENIESILEPQFTQIKWLKLYVTPEEGVPLFAPRVVPSNIFFRGAERISEGQGLIQSFENFSSFIQTVLDAEQSDNDPTEAQPPTQ